MLAKVIAKIAPLFRKKAGGHTRTLDEDLEEQESKGTNPL